MHRQQSFVSFLSLAILASVLCEFCVYLLRHMISVIELCDKSETSVMNYSRTAEFFTDVCHSS